MSATKQDEAAASSARGPGASKTRGGPRSRPSRLPPQQLRSQSSPPTARSGGNPAPGMDTEGLRSPQGATKAAKEYAGAQQQNSSSQSRLLLYDPDEPLLPHDIHVLFVEDEPLSRRVGVKHLVNEGYKVTEAPDGATAWGLLKHEPYGYDLVVSDVTMPKMNGTELLAAIRGDETFADLPVVMMSSTEEAEVCYRCLTNGADDFLIKPVRPRKVTNLWQVVWKKQKETLTALELVDEKRKRQEMALAIAGLHERISEAIETPLSQLIEVLDSVLANTNIDPELAASIHDALATLGEKSLYQNAFEKSVKAADMDGNTKAWLLGQVRSATAVATPNRKDEPRMDSLSTRRPSRASQMWRVESSDALGITESDEEAILADLADLESFEMLTLSESDMVRHIVVMFSSIGGPAVLDIELDVFASFVDRVRATYRDNPYHNFNHAFDVTQFVHWLLVSVGAMEKLSALDTVATFLAALCHDVDHPGLNNNFQINTMSELALRYNDASVLENHHAATTFGLIFGSGPDHVLSNLSPQDLKAFRKIMVACILGTDLASHVNIMRRWDEIAPTYDLSNPAHREILTVMLVKCGDISNPMRPFNLSKFWSDMIIEEGLSQGAQEASLGLPISPGMDAATVNQCKMSVGFIDYFVMPSFKALAKVVPAIKDLGIPSLSKNRYRWQAMLDVQAAVEEALLREKELEREINENQQRASAAL